MGLFAVGFSISRTLAATLDRRVAATSELHPPLHATAHFSDCPDRCAAQQSYVTIVNQRLPSSIHSHVTVIDPQAT